MKKFLALVLLLLSGCSVDKLYEKVNNNRSENGITLKVTPCNERACISLNNKLIKSLKYIKPNYPTLIKISISNQKSIATKFRDGTVGRVFDSYTAFVQIFDKETFQLKHSANISCQSSKNYTSNKTQVINTTYGNTNECIIDELAIKIFQFIKVLIDKELETTV